MDIENKGIFSCVGVVLFVLISIVLSTIYSGWVFSVLWRWFVVTTFGTVPLTVVQAIGLATIKGLVFFEYKPNKNKMETSDLVTTIIVMFAVPTLSLAGGWLVTQFM